MELGGSGGGGGESAAKSARLSSGDAHSDASAGEDWIIVRPDEMLVLILCRLDTCGAVRTSVLSRRWRRVWALLPGLHFRNIEDPLQIRAALEAHAAALLRLSVRARNAAPDSMSAWLPVAACRLSGDFLLSNSFVREMGTQEDDEEETAQRGAVELPSLERAAEVGLDLGFLGLAVPPVGGVFSRLTALHLRSVRFHGPGLLGDAVSSPRCPCPQQCRP